MAGATADRSWDQLTTANDDIDGQLLVGVLEDAGIDTKVVKNRSGYGDYLYGGSNPWAPVAVHVPAERLQEARAVLDRLGHGDASDADAAEAGTARRGPGWPVVVAVGIVALIVLSFLLQQRDLVF